MLKIKDGIDLKELEKFGFIKNGFNYTRLVDENDPIKKQCLVIIPTISNLTNGLFARHIHIMTPLSITQIFDGCEYIVEDLIQAGLVEKVSGEQ